MQSPLEFSFSGLWGFNQGSMRGFRVPVMVVPFLGLTNSKS